MDLLEVDGMPPNTAPSAVLNAPYLVRDESLVRTMLECAVNHLRCRTVLVKNRNTELSADLLAFASDMKARLVETNADTDTCERWVAGLSEAREVYPDASVVMLPGDCSLDDEARDGLGQLVAELGRPDAGMVLGVSEAGLREPYAHKQFFEWLVTYPLAAAFFGEAFRTIVAKRIYKPRTEIWGLSPVCRDEMMGLRWTAGDMTVPMLETAVRRVRRVTRVSLGRMRDQDPPDAKGAVVQALRLHWTFNTYRVLWDWPLDPRVYDTLQLDAHRILSQALSAIRDQWGDWKESIAPTPDWQTDNYAFKTRSADVGFDVGWGETWEVRGASVKFTELDSVFAFRALTLSGERPEHALAQLAKLRSEDSEDTALM